MSDAKPYAEMPHEAVAYAARVAEALSQIPVCKTDHGEYYVAQADIAFDGDPTGLAVCADEFGTYSVRMEAH